MHRLVTINRLIMIACMLLLNVHVHLVSSKSISLPSLAIKTAKLLTDPDNLNYCITGQCINIKCGFTGCKPITSSHVTHRLPELLLLSYADIDQYLIPELKTLSKTIGKVTEHLLEHRQQGGVSINFGHRELKRPIWTTYVDIWTNPAINLVEKLPLPLCKVQPKIGLLFSSALDPVWSLLPELDIFSKNAFKLRKISSDDGENWGYLDPRSAHVSAVNANQAMAISMHRALDVLHEKRAHIVLQKPEFVANTDWQQRVHGWWSNLSNSESGKLLPNSVHDDSEQLTVTAAYIYWTEYSCCLQGGEKVVELPKAQCLS